MTDQQRNPAATFALLASWRAALADSALIHPTVTADCPRIQIGADDKGRWQVTSAPKNWIETTFSTSKASKDDDEGTRKPVPLLLIPSLLVPESLHGVKRGKGDADENLVPLCIPCMLGPGGSLSVDNERLPWIPRTLLEPTYQQVTVGTLQALDDYLTQLTDKPKTLTDTFNIAAALFAQVAGQRLALLPTASSDDSPAPPLLEMAGYGVIDAWFAIPYEPPVMARHLIRLYDQLAQQANIPPLLASLTHLPDRPAKPPLPLPKTAARYKKIIGHINRKHPLSPSQHGAMVELLDLKVGELLAVNGPPGTGKTTLLQSVVAQQWVTAAINNEPCPVIAATSTNVKAVENVLDSFAKLGREIAHQRWLPDIGGFGLFLASASRTSEHPTFKSPDQHYFLPFETPEWQGKSTEYYLNQAKKMPQLAGKATDVPTVVAALQKLLRNYAGCLQKIVTLRYQIFDFTSSDERIGAVTGLRNVCRECESNMILAEREIQRAQQIIDDSLEKKKEEQTRHHASLREIKQVELAWSVYLSSLPSFLLDLLSFLPPVQRWRNARDRAFLLGHALTSELPHCGDGLVEDHFSKLTRHEKLRYRSVIDELEIIENAATNAHRQARNDKEKYAARLGDALALQEKWCTLLGDTFAAMSDVSLEELNDQLDISLRAPMFQLADWYWSGCWLLEMESRIRDGSKDSKSPQKLEAMLRRFAKLAPCMVSNFHMLPAFFCGWMGSQAVPLWNMIDLLIVDEAGQVSPEIGAPSFALAKRAIVVGDVHQIEPIWNVKWTPNLRRWFKLSSVKG